jgi:hypothetical protein
VNKHEALKKGQKLPKGARLIGKNTRYDAVTGSTFLFQVATLNYQLSDFSISIIDSEGQSLDQESFKITRHENGIFDVAFETPKPGYYLANVVVDEIPLDGFPLLLDTLDDRQLHPKLQSELKAVRSFQETLSSETVHPQAFHLFVDSKTWEFNAALERVQQAKVSAAGLLGVSGNHCDAYLGEQFSLCLPSVNTHAGDFEAQVLNSVGRVLTDSVRITKFPNGILAVSFPITELTVHVVHLTFKGIPWTPIRVHVFSKSHLEGTPGLQGLFASLNDAKNSLKETGVPIFSDETSFWEFLNTNGSKFHELASKIAEHRIRFARIVGPAVRYDAVEHVPFFLQIATINGQASDLKDVRVTHKSRKLEGVHIREYPNGVLEVEVPVASKGRYKIEATFNDEDLAGSPVILHVASTERSDEKKQHFSELQKIREHVKQTALPSGREEIEGWVEATSEDLGEHLREVRRRQVVQHGRPKNSPKKSRTGVNFVVDVVSVPDLEFSEISFSLKHVEISEDERSLAVTKVGEEEKYAIRCVSPPFCPPFPSSLSSRSSPLLCFLSVSFFLPPDLTPQLHPQKNRSIRIKDARER